MKKITCFTLFFLVLNLIALNGQTYLINFTGTELAYVKVENLSSGLTVNVNAGETLRLSNITGVPDYTVTQPTLEIWPNPARDKSILRINVQKNGKALISIFDAGGKPVIQYDAIFGNNLEKFEISGLERGVYFISVKGNSYQLNGKLICSQSSAGKPDIHLISGNVHASETVNSEEETKGSMSFVDMVYNPGERLKYTASAGNNRTVSTDVPAEDKTVEFTFIECKDGDDNYYPIVQIGTQTWMAENLKTTKYLNGDLILTTTSGSLDYPGVSPEYQWAYERDESNVEVFGRLYTWHTAMDNRKVCPAGWHLPSNDEWSTLITFLGGQTVAGGKLKETGTSIWDTPNIAGNETGFSFRPGGISHLDNLFFYKGYAGSCWTSTEHEDVATARVCNVAHFDGQIYRSVWHKSDAVSVRCVKD